MIEDDLRQALDDLGITEDEAEMEINDFMSIEASRLKLEDIYIGCAGFAQVGANDYYAKQRFEAKFLKEHIFKNCGKPPEGSWLSWQPNPHDFGTYHDLHYMADMENKKHMSYIAKIERIDFDELVPLIEQAYNHANAVDRAYSDEEIERDNEIFKLLE
jgi:hypothetical protein